MFRVTGSQILRRAAVLCAAAAALPAAPALAQQDGAVQVQTTLDGGCADGGAGVTTIALAGTRSALVCLVNAERARFGLKPVTTDVRLQRSANGHSHDMVARGYFGHVSPSGGTLAKRIRRAGYLRTALTWDAGETLAFGTGSVTPLQLFTALLSSPAHAAIIHDGRFRQLGVGLERGVPDAAEPGMTTTLEFGVVSVRRR